MLVQVKTKIERRLHCIDTYDDLWPAFRSFSQTGEKWSLVIGNALSIFNT